MALGMAYRLRRRDIVQRTLTAPHAYRVGAALRAKQRASKWRRLRNILRRADAAAS